MTLRYGNYDLRGCIYILRGKMTQDIKNLLIFVDPNTRKVQKNAIY